MLGVVQNCGWSMEGEQALWLGLSDREKVDLNAPIETKALFRAWVTAMLQQCGLRKQEVEAFQTRLP